MTTPTAGHTKAPRRRSLWLLPLALMATLHLLFPMTGCPSGPSSEEPTSQESTSEQHLPDQHGEATPESDSKPGSCGTGFPDVDQLPIKTEVPELLQNFCSDDKAKNAATWEETRRREILLLYHHYVYGIPPETPDASKVSIKVETSQGKVLDGTATRKLISIQVDSDSPIIQLLLYVPADKQGPFPVFLGLNFFGNHSTIDDPDVPLATGWIPDRGEGVKDNKATEASRGTVAERWSIRQNIKAGYAVATLYHGDIDPDQPDGLNWVHKRFGATAAIREKPESGGTLNAWAWGLSRALDALVKDPDIDTAKVWVMGHSRNGKAAILAAARDNRFAGVISNQSGCMGAALNRGKSGETIKTIQPFFPHWFNGIFGQFVPEPDKLPVDQHMFLALIAPRPLLVATATADTWSDPPSAWRAVKAAQPAWSLYNKPQPALGEYPEEGVVTGKDIAFHRRPGGHSVTADDWKVFVMFANQSTP